MQFIGSSVWEWEGQPAFKARNKLNIYVQVPQITLTSLKFDPRYFEFYQDFGGTVWVKRPAGKQIKLPRPYTLITRTGNQATGEYELVAKEVLDL